jgi:hypothetical protein
MVRSVAADTKDSHMCYLLASQVQDPLFFEPEICFECSIACIKVVHGAMHGFTRFRFAAAAAVFARAREKIARFIAHLFASVCLVNNRTVYAAPIHVFILLILTHFVLFIFLCVGVTGTFPLRTSHARSQMRVECP